MKFKFWTLIAVIKIILKHEKQKKKYSVPNLLIHGEIPEWIIQEKFTHFKRLIQNLWINILNFRWCETSYILSYGPGPPLTHKTFIISTYFLTSSQDDDGPKSIRYENQFGFISRLRLFRRTTKFQQKCFMSWFTDKKFNYIFYVSVIVCNKYIFLHRKSGIVFFINLSKLACWIQCSYECVSNLENAQKKGKEICWKAHNKLLVGFSEILEIDQKKDSFKFLKTGYH